jgi:uncharacterized membrane protein
MNKNFLILVGLIVVIGLLSILLTYFRSEKMTSPAEITSKGLAAIRKGNVIFYGLFMPVLVGLISFFTYRGMLARSPESASTTFLYLAVGIGIVFTILAAVVFKMRGFFELTILHILYVTGFGWFIPLLWAK